MRKNLTISLAPQEWRLAQRARQSLGITFSALFRRLIRESLESSEINPRTIAKYHPLFKQDAAFLAHRALVFLKATRHKS